MWIAHYLNTFKVVSTSIYLILASIAVNINVANDGLRGKFSYCASYLRQCCGTACTSFEIKLSDFVSLNINNCTEKRMRINVALRLKSRGHPRKRWFIKAYCVLARGFTSIPCRRNQVNSRAKCKHF